ncbi:MAG: ZIP family metal transporter [Firmicutes bacterium]|nr:ZIP family metal transporter [Bacillota bacterium]
MSRVVMGAIIGLLSGLVGTGAGGLALRFFGRPSDRVFSIILGFSGGIMLSMVAFDLMPQAFRLASVGWGIAGLVGGALLIGLIDLLTPHVHFMSDDTESSRFVRASLLIGIGIAIHNLPEGLAIGAGYLASERFGIGLAIMMMLHNAPEGMAMSAPMCRVDGCTWKVVGWAAAAGLPEGVGALIGLALGGVSPIVLALALGFAAGAMLFITCDELIPDAQEFRVGHTGTWGIVAGVVTGIVLSTLLELH